MCYFFIIMDTVYGLISLIMISCIFDESASQPENLASIFNSSSLHFLRMIQYRFCGTKNQCDKNLTFEDPESVNIYESFKSVIPTTSVIPITVSHEYSRVKCCKSCSCDLSTCQERGTCCTDILTPDIVTSETYSTFTCESAQLRPSKSEVQNGNSLWMIGKCSMAFVSDTDKAVIKRKCENGTEYLGLDTTSPVTDIESQITYRNRYCLECNNKSIKNAVIWNGRLRCTEDEAAALLNLDSDNIIGSITRTKTCNIVYERPPGTTFEVTNCNLGISKCNVTGRLAVYDPFIEAACHMFTNKIKTYKNVFCYMCNTIVTEEWCYVLVRSKTYPPLFSSLLKYMPDNTHKNNADDVDTSACTDSQIYDMMQVCNLNGKKRKTEESTFLQI
ncbi:uncharacterized protein LOC123530986 isoform X2 [Mercenaria mercenaria]|uniref:uncharacterized protein LOC123530986 isoform X2 n=1 Tax=Mercenaria mercenaria TaxID=6596 RepID=UPI00234E76A6|nr:uncharacterized protein LOC123530986 isoform X2 [Mercenaria mercenaria]